MSTSFTKGGSPQRFLQPPLGLLLMSGQQWVMTSLLHMMAQRGHEQLTAAHLMFFGNLDCGDTYASEAARRMGVTRQAIYRTTRELQRLKLLKLETDTARKTQKIIKMTARGQQVALDARACLDEIETTLRDRIGARDLERLTDALAKPWGPPAGR